MTNKTLIDNITFICLSFFIFLAIFAPPFLPFNLLYFLFGISIIYFFKQNDCNKIYNIFNKWQLFLFLFVSCYIFFNVSINELLQRDDYTYNRLVLFYQLYVLIPAQYIVCVAIRKFIIKRNYDDNNFFKALIIGGLIESIIVLIAFFSSEVRNILLNIMTFNTGKSRLYANVDMLSYRGYGFAATLLDTFGYGIGLLAGLCLLRKKQTLFTKVSFILLMFTTLVNSRTGIAVILISIVVKFFMCLVKFRFLQIIKLIIKIIFFLCIFYYILISYNSKIEEWIWGGFSSVYYFISNTEASYQLGSMKNSMFSPRFWRLPDDLFGIIFGRGHSVFGIGRILHSDVGYINYIWICGLFGISLIAISVLSVLISKYKQTSDEEKRIGIIFIGLTFFIVFIKGNIINYNAGTFISLLYLININNNAKKRIVYEY